VFLQDGVGLVMSLIDQQTNLLINFRRHIWRVVQSAAATTAYERIALLLAVRHRAELWRHAVLGHHGASNFGGLFNIGRSTGSRQPEDQLLGSATAHGEDQTSEELWQVVHALVILGDSQRMTAGATTSEDSDLVNTLD